MLSQLLSERAEACWEWTLGNTNIQSVSDSAVLIRSVDGRPCLTSSLIRLKELIIVWRFSIMWVRLVSNWVIFLWIISTNPGDVIEVTAVMLFWVRLVYFTQARFPFQWEVFWGHIWKYLSLFNHSAEAPCACISQPQMALPRAARSLFTDYLMHITCKNSKSWPKSQASYRLAGFKGDGSLQNENFVIIYSLISYCFKPVWLSFLFETQKLFWKISRCFVQKMKSIVLDPIDFFFYYMDSDCSSKYFLKVVHVWNDMRVC